MRTSLIDIFKRVSPWNKSVEVYSNDTDNAYPERMDRLINNSVSAKTSAAIMVQYLLGKGYGDNNNIIVNKTKNLRLIDFADDVADDLVKQRGVFIHLNWNALYQISDMCVLPFDWCRLGKMDSKDYAGKIVISQDWAKAKKDDVEKIDVYNPRKKVIDAQVEKAGGWENYKGQVLFVNMDTKLIYPLSRIDAVALDCDSESQAGVYKNTILRKGFFGPTIFITRPLVDNELEGQDRVNAESERTNLKDNIKGMIGAENADSAMLLEMDFAGEKLEDAILIKQIESKIDDKLFDYTERSVRDNILVAFNNLPVGLMRASESVFGNSGESLIEMKRTYWENTTKERLLLTDTINNLLEKTSEHSAIKVKPIRIIETDEKAEGQEETPDKEKLLAQATLKGSVGGVQALLQIQASVSAGTTSINAAIAILKEIFGFSEETARAVIGNPETITV